MRKNFLKYAVLALAFAFAGCSDDKQENPAVVENPADLVVYGTVYTAKVTYTFFEGKQVYPKGK